MGSKSKSASISIQPVESFAEEKLGAKQKAESSHQRVHPAFVPGILPGNKLGGKLKTGFRKVFALILFFLLWDFLARFGFVDKFILPTITDVLKAFWDNIINGQLLKHTLISLQRTGTGFILAVAVGTVLGVAMGWFTKIEQYLDPIFQLFRNTSVLALFPVFIMALGLGESSKVAVIFWGALWPSMLSTIGGVKGADPVLIKSARSMGVSTLQLFKKVVIPAALPEMLTGIRLSAGTSIILLVAAEMLGASKGLGYLIFYMQQMYDTPTMFMGIVTISIIGVVINWLLVLLENKVASWKRYYKAG